MRRRFAFITILTTLAAASPAAALDRLVDIGDVHWVEVTGEGSVNAPPDFARVMLGVTNTAKTAGEAMAANANAANALVSLIKSGGVAPADIQTSEVSISPMFSQPAPGQRTAPTITGYSVSNNVAVTLRDIPRLGALLDKAVTAGANSIYGVGFGHNDTSALLDSARTAALADANRKANVYAIGAGARIGRTPDAHRGAKQDAADRPLFPPRLRRRRRSRPDANRSGRGQTDRDRHGAV